MITVGIGCKRNVEASEVHAAVRIVLAAHGRHESEIAAVATERTKTEEPAILALALVLGVPILAFEAAELAAASNRVLTRSARVEFVKDTPSVAEAAALLACEPNGRLLGPRIATAAVTAALADGDGP